MTRHEQAEAHLGGLGRGEDRDDAAFEDDRDPVGERPDLVELARDEEDRRARLALLEQALVDVPGGATSRPRGLAMMSFMSSRPGPPLVVAGEGPRGEARVGRPDVELARAARRARSRLAEADARRAGDRLR